MKITDLTGGYENMATPPSSQSSTSIAKITMFGIPAIPFLYVGFLYLVNAVLPAEDATRAKAMLDTFFPALAIAIGGGGPASLFIRSLMLTNGKIKAQTPQLPDTVNAAGDVTVSSTPQLSAHAPLMDEDWIDSDGDGISDEDEVQVMSQ